LKAGAQLLWIVDPEPRDVTVFAGTERPRTLKGDQVLSGATVLRGFSVAVSDIFAVLDRAQQTTAP
jgi:Uma2 family endonuclease